MDILSPNQMVHLALYAGTTMKYLDEQDGTLITNLNFTLIGSITEALLSSLSASCMSGWAHCYGFSSFVYDLFMISFTTDVLTDNITNSDSISLGVKCCC